MTRNELSVRVAVPGSREAVYRFAEPVVRVGRSDACHLSICHEAVPRELCRAWVEEGGGSVRVEERPGLRNPLMKGKRPVRGGVAGPVLHLSIGPVSLVFEPADPIHRPASSAKPGLRRAAFAGLALATVACAVLLASDRLDRTPLSGPVDTLPATPFASPTRTSCPDVGECVVEARLSASRARELLSRPGATPGTGVAATRLLRDAATKLALAGASDATDVATQADDLERRTLAAYRREVLALERALERGDEPAKGAAARNLIEFLGAGDDPARTFLSSLARAAGPVRKEKRP
ncbi:MAG: hypothetical protein PHU25_01360 [Deltaproteobacteria bacterium]|nr:hypothetical protein [Deltaproteobacteria bacterium]